MPVGRRLMSLFGALVRLLGAAYLQLHIVRGDRLPCLEPLAPPSKLGSALRCSLASLI